MIPSAPIKRRSIHTMGFLKFSVVFLFLLSLISAGASVYLSTIRENEKEKRIRLEQVRDDLEVEIDALESKNTQLVQEATKLRSRNQELEQKYGEAEEARTQALNLIREKDMDLDALQEEVSESKKAFTMAQKRNQELERVLKELELRMSGMTRVEELSNPAATYVAMELNPEATASPVEAGPPVSTSLSGAGEPGVVKDVEPEAELPKPKKKRRGLFSFLRRSKNSETSTENVPSDARSAVPVLGTASSAPDQMETMAIEQGVEEAKAKPVEPTPSVPAEAPPKPESVGTPVSEVKAMPKTDQAIAAGRVLLINRKFNFLVTNLGSRQGLSMDDVLVVERNGAQIAKVRVEKLYDDYCAAYVIEEQIDMPIGEGDLVTAA